MRFPTMPTLENGQLLGAAALASYRRAILWLLGDSHGDYAPHHVPLMADNTIWETDYVTMWTCYMVHQWDNLTYNLQLWQDSGSGLKQWHARIQVNKAGVWTDAVTLSGTDTSPAVYAANVNLVALGLTVGRVYEWRVQLKTDDGTYHAKCAPWLLAEYPVVVGYTPLTFVDGVSDAAHLNTLKANAEVLYDHLPLALACQAHQPDTGITAAPGVWQEVLRTVYRYKPSTLYVQVQLRSWEDTIASWRVVVEDQAGHSAVVHTEPGQLGQGENYFWLWAEIDLTAGAPAAALAAAGITLTVGDLYRVRIEGASDHDPTRAWFRHIIIHRRTSGTPAAGWVAPNAWAHGDQDVSAALLNVYADDLDMLYTGAEADFRQSVAVSYPASGLGHSGPRRRRYLWYLAHSQPRLYYGTWFGLTYDPPWTDADTWEVLDMEEAGLAPGGYWMTDNTIACFESDTGVIA